MSTVIFNKYEVSRCADGNIMSANGTVDGKEFSCDENSYDKLSVAPAEFHQVVVNALRVAVLPNDWRGRDFLSIKSPVAVEVAG